MNRTRMASGPVGTLAEALSGQAARIRELEEAAERYLHEQKDPEQYKAQLEEKAELLSTLPERVQQQVSELPSGERERVEESLESLAHSADMALGLDSVFFMRQLLYPEDYQEGEDNDLERLIHSLTLVKGKADTP